MNTPKPIHLPLTIIAGATLRRRLRYSTDRRVYKAITGASRAAPCVLTVPDHGVPDGWPVLVSNVLGMTELNRGEPNEPRPCDFFTATLVDEDTIELNQVNAAGFGAYRSGGVLTYFQPADLAGMTGTIEFYSDPEEDPVLEIPLVIDADANTIEIVLTDEQAAALDPIEGTHRVNLIASNGDVIRLACGPYKKSDCGC